MKIKKFLQSLEAVILQSEKRYEPMTKKQLKHYHQTAKETGIRQDIRKNMFQLWQDETNCLTRLDVSLAKVQIDYFIDDAARYYGIDIWYFKHDQRPFFIDIIDTKAKAKNYPEVVETIMKDYPCECMRYKDKLSKLHARELHNQIVYHCLSNGIAIINQKACV